MLSCRHPNCEKVAYWTAINNEPEHGHLCTEHYEEQPALLKLHYCRIDYRSSYPESMTNGR